MTTFIGVPASATKDNGGPTVLVARAQLALGGGTGKSCSSSESDRNIARWACVRWVREKTEGILNPPFDLRIDVCRLTGTGMGNGGN